MILRHSQVWESSFQDSLSLFCSDADILREKWTCLRVPSWWIGKTVIQTWVCLFPNASHNLFHYATSHPRSLLSVAFSELSGGKFMNLSKREFTRRLSGTSRLKEILKDRAGEKERRQSLVIAQVLSWNGKKSWPISLSFGQVSIFREEAPDGPDFGAWAHLLTRVGQGPRWHTNPSVPCGYRRCTWLGRKTESSAAKHSTCLSRWRKCKTWKNGKI